jgi:23S rRNA (pseudouridine1915-N3)-methyltransferase
MRLVITAVGKLKDGPERELFARYAGRISAAGKGVALGPLDLRELPEGRAQSRDARLADEAERVLARSSSSTVRVLLDERGKPMTSVAFANFVRTLRDHGEAEMAFLIGGADGHGESARRAAQHALSLGALTLPHGLARVVLAEQLYRAITIISGHPYHRE